MYKDYKYIDSDAHVLEPADMWENYLEPEFRDEMPTHFAGYENDPPTFHLTMEISHYTMPNFPTGRGIVVPGAEKAYRDFMLRGFTPDCYRDAMDNTGIDYMVVYPTVGLYATAVPHMSAAKAAAYRRAYNNWLYDFTTECGPRVVGVGSVDLRDPKEAAREARRCVKDLGFKAITINPEPVDEHPLHDEVFDPLWSEIEDLDVALGVHVAAGTSRGQVGTHYFPMWSAGRGVTAFSLGNMIASLSLIAGGVLERHPKMRVVHLESGAGWVPFWVDRMLAGVAGASRELGVDGMPGLTMLPVDYWKRQCFISADPDDAGVKMVVDYLGADTIVTASDLGHLEGRGYMKAIPETLSLEGISDEIKRKMMWDNPSRLYGIVE